MGGKEILAQALKLKPSERLMLVEGLIQSIDEPDKLLDEIWAQEAEKRLIAYRSGNLAGIPYQNIFTDE